MNVNHAPRPSNGESGTEQHEIMGARLLLDGAVAQFAELLKKRIDTGTVSLVSLPDLIDENTPVAGFEPEGVTRCEGDGYTEPLMIEGYIHHQHTVEKIRVVSHYVNHNFTSRPQDPVTSIRSETFNGTGPNPVSLIETFRNNKVTVTTFEHDADEEVLIAPAESVRDIDALYDHAVKDILSEFDEAATKGARGTIPPSF